MKRAWVVVVYFLGVVGAPAIVGAEERFQWKGQVDGTDEILVQGSSVRVNHLEAKPIQSQDYRFSASLPRRAVEVELRVVEGRGRVRLMEQPSERNDYTAIVRIEDDRGGDARYEFELVWDDAWDDDWGDDDGWDRGHERVFRWEGRVDIGAKIAIRGESHTVDDLGGSGVTEYRAWFEAPLPERDVPVSLRKLDGRGDVELVQTPSAGNDYTAVVTIDDDKSGADRYELELRWRER